MVAIEGGGCGRLVGFTLTDIFHESDSGRVPSIPTTTKPHAGAEEEGHAVNLVVMKNMDYSRLLCLSQSLRARQ
eukprot:11212467-Lingulodinium_polyedra.AAC.1